MTEKFENTKFTIIYFQEEKILEFYIKDIEIEKEDIIEMHKQGLALTKNTKYGTVFQAQDFFSISSEARDEGAKPHYSEYLIAQGLVVKNLAQRLVGNFIMKFNKPIADTRLFTDYTEARAWVAGKIKLYETKKKKVHVPVL